MCHQAKQGKTPELFPVVDSPLIMKIRIQYTSHDEGRGGVCESQSRAGIKYCTSPNKNSSN